MEYENDVFPPYFTIFELFELLYLGALDLVLRDLPSFMRKISGFL